MRENATRGISDGPKQELALSGRRFDLISVGQCNAFFEFFLIAGVVLGFLLSSLGKSDCAFQTDTIYRWATMQLIRVG